MTLTDSSENQDRYLGVITNMLGWFDASWAAIREMGMAMNACFTVLFRGQWNPVHYCLFCILKCY